MGRHGETLHETQATRSRRPPHTTLSFALPIAMTCAVAASEPFIRGDFTLDLEIQLADPIATLDHLFLSGGEPLCRKAGDSNDDGELGLSDALYTLSYLFLGSAAPDAPFPSCGNDPSEDRLDCASTPCPRVLVHEAFDDVALASRGWYDNTVQRITSVEPAPGSSGCVEFHFPRSATRPDVGGGMRIKFPATERVYLSYWVRYSTNWEGSNRPYHPHEFSFVTDADSRWVGPASTHLTTYIEQNEGRPQLGIQDAENIDEARVGEDLTAVTEQRAVAGCNGSGDSNDSGDCYRSGKHYRNGKCWKAPHAVFTNESGPYYKADWHFVEAYFALNSIVEGRGVADGVVRYWFDGSRLFDHADAMLRTAENKDMAFNQFLIVPWIGDGSPVEQTFWVDELTIATGRPRR